MGKKKSSGYNLDGSPVTNPNATQDFDNSSNLLGGSSLYKENAGAQDVGGRLKHAGFANDYFEEKVLGINAGEVTNGYSKMGADSFNPFKQDTDYEKIRKDNQSTANASVNMLGQFVAKTAINTVGGVIGGFYSIGSAAANWDASKMVDNTFLRGLDSASENVDKNMSVFTSQTDKDNGAFGMFSGLETMKSVSDAFAFTAGAIATEMIMQSVGNVLTGGAAEAGLPGRAIRYAAGIGKAFSQESKIGRGIAKAGDLVGVGNGLRKIGADAELVSAFIRNADTPAAARLFEKAAMAEGMGMEGLKKYRDVARAFEVTGSGLRKVVTGSMYEGSLEGRQAYDSMMDNAQVTIDAQMMSEGIPEEKREAEKAKRLAKADETAKSMMFQVMAVNVGLLSVSNAIQFPTLFGLKSFDPVKGMNTNSSFFTKNAVTGLAERATAKGYQKVLGKGVGALKEPFTEFMEETLQGVISKTSQNYHERLTQTNSHTGGMEHPISEFTSNMWKAVKKQYGEKEGIEEGLIGAIVGAIGGPSFKRNKNGKIRPTIHGGLLEHFQDESAEQKQAIQEAMDVLNAGGQLSSLKYNLDQSKMNSFSTNEKNKAEAAGRKGEYNSIGTDEIFQHVSNYLDKGLKDHYTEEKKTLQEMDEAEYTTKTRGEGVEPIAKEQKEKELKDYFDKADAYAEAYEKVYKNMRMDKMDDNPLNKKLLSHLAYAVAKDKTELAEFDEQSKLLQQKGLKMTPREVYRLAKMHNKLGTFTKSELEAEIKSLTSDAARNHFEDYRDNSIYLQEEFQGKNISKASIRKAVAFMGKLDGSEDMVTARKEIDRIEKMGSEGVRVPLSTMRTRELVMNSDAYKNAKEKLSQENLEAYSADFIAKSENQIEKKNMRANISAAKKFQSNQSDVMKHLAGKEERILGVDIEQYLKDIEKYNEHLTEGETVPKLFIDTLDSKGTEDINALLEELSETVGRRETSLRVAANLYGITGVNKALSSIARAELIANYKNNQYYRQALVHFMKNGGNDDSGAEEAIAFKKLELSLKSLTESRNSYKAILEADEEGNDQTIIDILSALDKEINISKEVMEFYNEIVKAEDAQAEATAAANKENETNSVEKVVGKIKKEIVEDSEADVAEALAINNLLLEHGELINAPKTSLDLYASSEESKQLRDGGLSELIRLGEIKKGNIVYLRPSKDLSLQESTAAVMSEKQKEMYNKGLALFEGDSTLIADKDIMDPAQFTTDGVLNLDDSDNAALQFFVMTYRVDKEITNDSSFNGEGQKRIIQKEGNDRIIKTSFLYSPYYAFEKDTKLAENFRDLLNYDIEQLSNMTNSLEDDSLTDTEKLQVKAKIDLLAVSIKARQLKANDATLYELRKKILLGLKLHQNSSKKDESYAMNTYVSDFNYGKIAEHTVDGKPTDYKNYNNFPIFNVGDENASKFNENDNFLSEASSAEELFNQDKLYICFKDHQLVSVKTGAEFKFASSQLSTGAENDSNEKEEVLPAGETKTEKKYSVGKMYYMHETKTGITVPVKLSMNQLKDSESTMTGIKKYIKQAVDSLKEKEQDKSKTFKLYDEEITLEDGDFEGMFDNDENKPKTIHQLLIHFAPVMNNPKEINSGTMILSKGEKDQVVMESDENSGNSLLDELRTESGAKTNSKSKAKKSNVKVHFEFNTNARSMEEMDENAIDEIMQNIGNMRFYFKKALSVDASKEEGGKLKRPNVLNFAFSSGLVSHGFETNSNIEKIYSKTVVKNKLEDGKFSELESDKQVAMSIKPLDDEILGKTKRILDRFYGKPAKKENFFDALKRVFDANSKWDKDNKTNFDLAKMARQVVYLSNKRFRKVLKEALVKDENLGEKERAVLFKESVNAQVEFMLSELKSIGEKTTNKSALVILEHTREVVDKFKKQYEDKKNSSMFKAMYMFKSESEHYDELNRLLFVSEEVNNNLTPVLPEIKRKDSASSPSIDKTAYAVTQKFITDLYDGIMDNIALSKEHYNLSGTKNGGLPLDVSISTLKFNEKSKKYENQKRRTTPLLSKDGEISTADNGIKKVILNEQMPMQLLHEGKFIPFSKNHITNSDYMTFDENGKLLKGQVFLLVKNYENDTVKHLSLTIGLDDFAKIKNKDQAGKEKTLRYVTGINLFGYDAELTKNKKETNLITGLTSGAKTAKSTEGDVIKKVVQGPNRSESWESHYDAAMNALYDAESEAASAQLAFNKTRGISSGEANKSSESGVVGNLGEDLTRAERDALNQALTNQKIDKVSWLVTDRIKEENQEDDDYDQNVILDGIMPDKTEFVSNNFSEMSDEVFKKYIEDNVSEGVSMDFMLEAFAEDADMAKSAMDELVKRTKRTMPKAITELKNEEKKPKDLRGILGGEEESKVSKKDLYEEKLSLQAKLDSMTFEPGLIYGDENEGPREGNKAEFDAIYKRMSEITPQIMGYKPEVASAKKENIKKSTSTAELVIDNEDLMQIKDDLGFGMNTTIKDIVNDVRKNNRDHSDIDIFAAITKASGLESFDFILDTSETKLIARAVFGESFSDEEISKVIVKINKENDNCDVPF